MLQVPNLVKSDLVFNERLTEFSVDIYKSKINHKLRDFVISKSLNLLKKFIVTNNL